ncbi:hypothetical protein CR513_35146, partial [Mucuna pruriens]
MLSGIFPESNCSKLTAPPIASGKGPNNWLKLTSKTVKFFSNPISSGKHDLNALFIRIISFSLFMLPIPAGTHPWKWLLAKTMTETGEFPKLSGRSKTKRLWLMKIASRSLSKSSLGTVPSNSLNLRSRNFSCGRRSTTSGNFPAKRLLLRSNSKRSLRRSNLCGTVPQKRLGEVDEKAQLLREVTGNVTVVEVDSGDGADLRVVRRPSAENAGVVADIRSYPVSGEVSRIGENGFLPSLQGYVGIS